MVSAPFACIAQVINSATVTLIVANRFAITFRPPMAYTLSLRRVPTLCPLPGYNTAKGTVVYGFRRGAFLSSRWGSKPWPCLPQAGRFHLRFNLSAQRFGGVDAVVAAHVAMRHEADGIRSESTGQYAAGLQPRRKIGRALP